MAGIALTTGRALGAEAGYHPVKDVEQRQGQQRRYATAEGADPFFFVQFGQCLVKGHPVVLVLLLKLLHLRLQLLHGEHRARRLKGQRHDEDHERQPQQEDRDPVVGY